MALGQVRNRAPFPGDPGEFDEADLQGRGQPAKLELSPSWLLVAAEKLFTFRESCLQLWQALFHLFQVKCTSRQTALPVATQWYLKVM